MRAAPPDLRGTVMAVRFSLAQAAVLGLGLGAVAVAAVGARWDFALVAAGLGAVTLVWSVYRRQRRQPGSPRRRPAGRQAAAGTVKQIKVPSGPDRSSQMRPPKERSTINRQR
jgi:membrane protein implicated in regulation of membrane protease activity